MCFAGVLSLIYSCSVVHRSDPSFIVPLDCLRCHLRASLHLQLYMGYGADCKCEVSALGLYIQDTAVLWRWCEVPTEGAPPRLRSLPSPQPPQGTEGYSALTAFSGLAVSGLAVSGLAHSLITAPRVPVCQSRPSAPIAASSSTSGCPTWPRRPKTPTSATPIGACSSPGRA